MSRYQKRSKDGWTWRFSATGGTAPSLCAENSNRADRARRSPRRGIQPSLPTSASLRRHRRRGHEWIKIKVTSHRMCADEASEKERQVVRKAGRLGKTSRVQHVAAQALRRGWQIGLCKTRCELCGRHRPGFRRRARARETTSLLLSLSFTARWRPIVSLTSHTVSPEIVAPRHRHGSFRSRPSPPCFCPTGADDADLRFHADFTCTHACVGCWEGTARQRSDQSEPTRNDPLDLSGFDRAVHSNTAEPAADLKRRGWQRSVTRTGRGENC